MPPKKRAKRPPRGSSAQPRGNPAAGSRSRPAAAPGSGGGRQPAGGKPGSKPGTGGGATAFYTPGAGPFRKAVERRSAPLLLLLTQLPRLVIILTPLALVLLGFFLPLPAGLVALAIFFLLTGWLAYLSWPRTDARAKAIRVLMFLLVIALAGIRISRG